MMTKAKIEIAGVAVDTEYTQTFDMYNRLWERQPEYNLLFLKNVQNHMNDMLHACGYVFLNDVYVQFGFPRTPAGQLVGWTIKDDQSGYIDLGIEDHTDDQIPSFQLTFKVDGVIFDKI